MPNFKAYLDALFKTRTTPAEAAAAAMPDDSAVISLSFADGIDSIYTAPTDGYLCLGSQGDDQGISSVSCWSNGVETSINTLASGTIGNVAVFCPILKGQTKSLYVSKVRFAKFIKANAFLGGGYRSLLKALQSGGQLCLRLKNFLTLGRSELERLNFKDTSLTLCRKEDRRPTNARLTLLRHSTVMYRSPLGTATTQGSSTARFYVRQAPSATEGFGAAARILRTIVRSCLAGKGTQFTFNFPSLLTRQQKCKGEFFSSLVQVSLALPSVSANCEEVRYVA